MEDGACIALGLVVVAAVIWGLAEAVWGLGARSRLYEGCMRNSGG